MTDGGGESMFGRADPRWIAAGIAAVVLLLIGILVVVLVRRSGEEAAPPGTEAPAPPATELGPPLTLPPTEGTGTTVPAPGPTPPPAPPGPAPAAPPAANRTARLGQVRSWSFALGVAVTGRSGAALAPQFRGFDLVVLDGVDASADAVAALRAQGSIVLAYVNVGAIEEGRPWTGSAQAYRLDYWDEWDEWYADVSKPGFRSLVTGTMVPPMLAKGFDGLFLDNVDMIDTHAGQRSAMVGLVSELAATVRGRGGYLFAQNGEDSTVDAVAPYLDGWNREDVSFTYDHGESSYEPVSGEDHRAALATIRRLRARGLLVTTVDYLSSPDGPEAGTAVRSACEAGAVPSIGDIGLTRVFPPHRC
jgi:uncharacterized protein (TIGR01370 family)